MVARLRQCQVRRAATSHSDTCSKKRRLIVEADELWPFVSRNANPVWLWLAIDAETRLIVGCAVGPRDTETAEDL
jgi:hypothetical protein